MHNISVGITKNNPQLQQDLDQKGFDFREVNGYLIIARKAGIKRVVSKFNSEMVFANTDYFGGCGEQNARFINLKERTQKSISTINKALEMLGLPQPDDNLCDLYDSIELSSIRENSDLKKYRFERMSKDQLVEELIQEKEKNSRLQLHLDVIQDKVQANLSMDNKTLFDKLSDVHWTCEELKKVMAD
tara:strand:+ start:1593 stop:2156 length:564 start_codon:yes stop_codon:yes gene_type:complete